MKVISNSPEATEEIGFKIGKKLKAGDIVRLYGELGAGKTTMVKGIARALGIDRKDITSASFTIIAEYPGNPPFYHIDLYRTSAGADLDNTGIWDCIGSHSITVIEWAENAEDELPVDSIKVMIEDTGHDLREITVEGRDEKDWNYL
ncbi:MAG: tRNA (adenosine(37)-N6)-threonylcarbamoyltransferase complex ATPase subunit type 1 TsaE [Nitrospiraceae bacterium]|nr:MAG: tRNA (adenosine(37)-N6)-threonylcarbamoyltransferase complex ATPase subunit type 1 TsaE [Nitrospiraceae bacterium]